MYLLVILAFSFLLLCLSGLGIQVVLASYNELRRLYLPVLWKRFHNMENVAFLKVV